MSELRERLARLKKLAAERRGVGVPVPLPLVILCLRREGDESRPAGVHWQGRDGGRGPEIVYEVGHDQDERIGRCLGEIAKALDAPESWRPLVIVEGPDHVAPPSDLRRE